MTQNISVRDICIKYLGNCYFYDDSLATFVCVLLVFEVVVKNLVDKEIADST